MGLRHLFRIVLALTVSFSFNSIAWSGEELAEIEVSAQKLGTSNLNSVTDETIQGWHKDNEGRLQESLSKPSNKPNLSCASSYECTHIGVEVTYNIDAKNHAEKEILECDNAYKATFTEFVAYSAANPTTANKGILNMADKQSKKYAWFQSRFASAKAFCKSVLARNIGEVRYSDASGTQTNKGKMLRNCNLYGATAEETAERAEECRNLGEEFAAIMSAKIQHLSGITENAMGLSASYLHTRNMVIGGAAAVVGGAYLYDRKEDKKDKKKAEKERQEAERGIIKNVDGSKLDCVTTANFMKLECRATVTRLCQTENPSNPNVPMMCRSFNAGYCAGEGATSNYCLAVATKAYCETPNSQVASSPGCQWQNQRPASCKADPENVACLFSGTLDALKIQCQNFPNDPLCIAAASGRIVAKGGGQAEGQTGEGSTTTMEDVVAGDTNLSSQSEYAANDLLPPSANLWNSVSSRMQQACAAGNIMGCQ